MPVFGFNVGRQWLCGAVLGGCMAAAQAAVPMQQQAIVQSGSGADALQLQTVAVPKPAAHEVLIKVYAAAVNPVDWKPPTVATGGTPDADKSIPGRDVAGVVAQLGADVTDLKLGEAVFAVAAAAPAGALNGGYAQYAVAAADNVVPKPKNMSFEDAAGLGVAGVTGVRTVTVTHVAKGQRVLITGVAGGVGSFAAQAAKARGAYVIGTASARHNDYLHSIGVDEVIDYTHVKFEDQVKDVDVVIDTVGADTADRALTTLKKGGMYVSIVAHDMDAKCSAAGVVCEARGTVRETDHAIFQDVAKLAASGKLKVHVDKTFPLAQAAQAQALGEQGHTEGKIILIVDAAHAAKH